jgi:hypothetical protein
MVEVITPEDRLKWKNRVERGQEPKCDIKARIIYEGGVFAVPIHAPSGRNRKIKIIVHEGLLQNREYILYLDNSRETESEFIRMLRELREHKMA